jgi:hypothetical protein
MTEFDELEKELGSIRPRQPSAELKLRIAEGLKLSAPSLRRTAPRRFRRRAAMIGGLAAACLAWIVIVRDRLRPPEPGPRSAAQGSQAAIAFDAESPSIWSYRSALVRSPDSLDVVLDRHAVAKRDLQLGHPNVHAFARFDSDINNSLGEL